MFRLYHKMLIDQDFETTRHWPYAYGQFDNGTTITESHRRMYRQLEETAEHFGNPFETKHKESYLNWFETQSNPGGVQ